MRRVTGMEQKGRNKLGVEGEAKKVGSQEEVRRQGG